MKPVVKFWYTREAKLRLLKKWEEPVTDDYAGTDMYAVDLQNWKDESLLVINQQEVFTYWAKTPEVPFMKLDSFFDLPGATWEEQRSRVESDEIFYAYIHLPKERGAISPNEHAMALIEDIRIDKANFSHISQTGKINGGLLADLRHILIPILRELYAEKRTRLEQGDLLNRSVDKLAAAQKRIEELEKQVEQYREMVGEAYDKIHNPDGR